MLQGAYDPSKKKELNLLVNEAIEVGDPNFGVIMKLLEWQL